VLLPVPLPQDFSVSLWISSVRARLSADGIASAYPAGPILSDQAVSRAIREVFAATAQSLVSAGAVRHLVVAGGATAAAIAAALGWQHLRVRHNWFPGVVALTPSAAPDVMFSVKPGSYPWPPLLAARLAGRVSRSNQLGTPH
jgi:uncharacterized protein YgbK (DUF1537 family)